MCNVNYQSVIVGVLRECCGSVAGVLRECCGSDCKRDINKDYA